MSFKALSYKVKAGVNKIIILFLASQKCGAGVLIGTFAGALEQALKERKKAKLAKKIGIKR